MQANLRGTPDNQDEVIVREVEDPIPDVIFVDFAEVQACNLRAMKIAPDLKIHRRAYKFVTIVVTRNRFGYETEVAEYKLVDES